MRKHLPLLFSIAFLVLTLTACAPEPSCELRGPGGEYGFFSGLLHGILFPLALLGKLFGVKTGLYAVSNTGFWYWLGYFLGVGGLGGGASQAKRRR